MIDRVADRILNRTVGGLETRPPREAAVLHGAIPVVDLLVGTPLFRRGFLERIDHGHADLPRALEGGLDLVGFTIATRFNDLRGTLSTPHFAALGIPRSALSTDIGIVEAFLDRIDGWVAGSRGRLAWWSAEARLPTSDGGLRCFAGIQGGHALGDDLRSIDRFRARGVRLISLAHVMDTPLAGSGTGRTGGGLTPRGREVIAEMERAGVLVDLAHASVRAIEDALPRLTRPFVSSHTGFRALAGGRSRWRRYAPAGRNLPDEVVRDIGQAGGLVGVTMATDLIGGRSMDHVVRAFARALELVGAERVALGSDFDGALRVPFDVTGLPALTAALLDAGFGGDTVAAVMGGNALRVLRGAGRIEQHPIVPEDARASADARS